MKEVIKTEAMPPAPIVQTITPMDMLNKAVESGADLDKLEKLMDLQERWESREAKKQYLEAKTIFLADCPPVVKTKKGHNSKYSPLANTIKIVNPLLTGCGFSYDWKIVQTDGSITVTCILSHRDGHSEECPLTASSDDSGNKNDIQALGSTVQYLKRYSFEAIIGISSQDEDDDGNGTVGYINNDQISELLELNEKRENTPEQLCNYLGVSALAYLPKTRFHEAKQAVNAGAKK